MFFSKDLENECKQFFEYVQNMSLSDTELFGVITNKRTSKSRSEVYFSLFSKDGIVSHMICRLIPEYNNNKKVHFNIEVSLRNEYIKKSINDISLKKLLEEKEDFVSELFNWIRSVNNVNEQHTVFNKKFLLLKDKKSDE